VDLDTIPFELTGPCVNGLEYSDLSPAGAWLLAVVDPVGFLPPAMNARRGKGVSLSRGVSGLVRI